MIYSYLYVHNDEAAVLFLPFLCSINGKQNEIIAFFQKICYD